MKLLQLIFFAYFVAWVSAGECDVVLIRQLYRLLCVKTPSKREIIVPPSPTVGDIFFGKTGNRWGRQRSLQHVIQHSATDGPGLDRDMRAYDTETEDPPNLVKLLDKCCKEKCRNEEFVVPC